MAEFRAQPGRLDAVVAGALGVPRAHAQRAIDEGRVTVNGIARPKSFRLAGGEGVVADISSLAEVPPEDGGVPVRFRDDHLIVVSKPAHLPTHPTEHRRTGTLVNRLKGMGIPLSEVGSPLRPGIVHRLDAGTSGLMLVALTDAAHEALAAMFDRHDVDRRYLALARGVVQHDSFDVDAPLGRRGARVGVRWEGGRQARSSFVVLERLHRTTLLEVRPRTGRTHQIRVHLSSMGHPVLGDRAYGGGGDPAKRLGLDRPFLHSWRIGFTHPFTGKLVEIEEPLPEDLERALRTARHDGGGEARGAD
jgi:23S rRNA pseudouridine1911/1915/1917 synthase